MRVFIVIAVAVTALVVGQAASAAPLPVILQVQSAPLAWGDCRLTDKLTIALSRNPDLNVIVPDAASRQHPPFPNDRNNVDSRYFWHMLGSRTVTEKAWASTTGSAQPTIPLRAIRELPIPVPPLPEQRGIVAELDALQAEVDVLKRRQAETATELDALLPAILDRAFKGEL